ncbi:MAG: ABC transporter ATP-binding protein, partial [Bacilli bacterium]|nr:ABC transporter ATP-binding protein [Bacilli bacterium]
MLEVKNLTKTYVPKKGVPVVALNNVSLKIEDKGLVFILGKSGSGKSTLLNLLGGLDKYDEGDIVIKGKSTKEFTQGDFDSYRNTYVGFIFQEYNILDEFSVGANIALAIELQGRKASNEEVNRILDTLDLQGYGNRRPNELSGGQKQRIAIARALVKNPDIILADEPTGALDSKTGIQIFDILKKLAEEKLVLVVSHDRDFAEWYGDRVIELADGKIISDISKTTITNGQAKSSNVQYLEKEGVVVREGYKLTPKDLDMINHYLEREKSINISSKGEDEFYTRSVFVNTKESIEVKTYSSEFKMIKSRLPFKMAFKMGASGLSHKKIRLFFTILFSLVAFTLFGVTDSLAAYNKIDATVNSIIDGGIDSVAFAKTKTIETENGYNRIINLSLSEENIAELNDGVGKEIGLNFKPVFTAGAGDYEGAFNMNNNFSSLYLGSYNPYYLDSISGFVEYTKKELEDLGFEVTGEMPTKDNEIAVTSYIFDHFATKGYSNYDEELVDVPIDIEGKNFTKYENLIGNYISLRNYYLQDPLTFKVTAVVDTNLVADRYESLKTPQGDYYFLSEEFKTVIQFGFHGLGFVNSGFIKKLIEDESTSGIRTGTNIHLYYYSEVNQIWLSPQVVDKLESIDSDEVVFFNETKTSLEKGDILVNFEEFKWSYQKDITYEDFTGKIYDYENYAYEKLVREYAEENFAQAQANDFYIDRFGTNELPEEDKINMYFSYL